MIGRQQKTEARMVVARAKHNYGNAAFAVDIRGKHWQPLKHAEALGWCTFVGHRCRLTPAGEEVAAEYHFAVREQVA